MQGVRIASNSWNHDPPDMKSFDYTPSHCDALDTYLVSLTGGNPARHTRV